MCIRDRLIGDILDLSKIEAGTWEVAEVPVDVNALLEEVTKSLQLRACLLYTSIGLARISTNPYNRTHADDRTGFLFQHHGRNGLGKLNTDFKFTLITASHCSSAVSYTHLDVYKRQPLQRI